MPQEDGDDQRAACKAEFDRLRDAGEMDGERAEDHPQGDAEENGYEVGMAEFFGLVAHDPGHLLDAPDRADHQDAVSHLEDQIGAGDELHPRAEDTGHAHTIFLADVQIAQPFAGQGGFGDGEAPGDEALVLMDPVAQVHRDLFAEDDADAVYIGLGGDDQEFIAFVQDGVGTGDGDFAPAHDAGDDEFVAQIADHLGKAPAEHGRVFHLAVHAAGGLPGALFFLFQDGLFAGGIDLENALEQDQHEDDAEHADRIGHGVGGGEGGGGGGNGLAGPARGRHCVG